MNIRYGVIGITRDRRSSALKDAGDALERAFATHHTEAAQEALDAALEHRWRLRIRDNVLGIARARDEHRLPALLRRQAN